MTHRLVMMLGLLANCDIQAITSKWAVVEYITKCETETCGASKGSTPKTAEEQFDAALGKAKEKGKDILSTMATYLNSRNSRYPTSCCSCRLRSRFGFLLVCR